MQEKAFAAIVFDVSVKIELKKHANKPIEWSERLEKIKDLKHFLFYSDSQAKTQIITESHKHTVRIKQPTID